MSSTRRRFWRCSSSMAHAEPFAAHTIRGTGRHAAVRGMAALALTWVLAGCVSAPPRQPDNICAIFDEKRSWYRAASRTEKRWGIPAHVQLAIAYRESAYVARAKPPRTRLLWFIPWRRPSSAYGFAQATDAAWSDYLGSTGRSRASRRNFADSMDFIGWYNHESHRRLGIGKHDAYQLYLAYHEGHGGYARGTYRGKDNVQRYAAHVRDRAARYQRQLDGCAAGLERRRWWWPFG
jgi:hypothetical protein